MATNKGDVALNVSVPLALREEVKALSGRLGRSLRDEVIAALRRHLATPPVMELPLLPPAEPIPVSDPKPKKRGKDTV